MESKQSVDVCLGNTDGEGGDGSAEGFRPGKIDRIGSLVLEHNTYHIRHRRAVRARVKVSLSPERKLNKLGKCKKKQIMTFLKLV